MKTSIEAQIQKRASDGMGKNNIWKYFQRNQGYYYMLLPGLILIIIFRFIPLYGLQIAFKDYKFAKGFANSAWVGLRWFKVIFTTPDFFQILRNTLTISFLELLIVFPSSIIMALMLNELRNHRFKKLVQTVTYLPHFLSWVIVGGLLVQFFSMDSGAIKYIFEILGVKPYPLLLKESWFYPILITGEVWKEVGWGTILYLAAMSGIDMEQYEAARVDGAGRLRQLLYITLPNIYFIIVMMLVLKMGQIMNVGFEKIYVLGFKNDAVRAVSEVFSTFNYRVGIGQQRFSFSTAIGLFESVVNFILVLTANKVTKKLGQDGIF